MAGANLTEGVLTDKGRFMMQIRDAFQERTVALRSERFEADPIAARIVMPEKIKQPLRRYLPKAFEAGFRAVGIRPEELTVTEKATIQAFISEQVSYVDDVVQWVASVLQEYGQRDAAGNWKPMAERRRAADMIMNRAELWRNVWLQAYNLAKSMAAADQKLKWERGPTSDACQDCLRYDGRVYRASTWARYEVRPQHHSLACHGFRCLCTLSPTDDPLTPGRPPGMTGGA